MMPEETVAKKRITLEAKHRDALQRKQDKVDALDALVAEWDGQDRVEDPEYVADLRRRLRSAQVQLAAMRP